MPNPHPKTAHLKGNRTGRKKMKVSQKRIKTSITLLPEIKSAAEQAAKEQGISLSLLLEAATNAYLQNQSA